MADDKQPHHDPSQRPDDEAQQLGDEGQRTQDDAAPTEAAVDPETRMLREIAALEGDATQRTGDDTQQPTLQHTTVLYDTPETPENTTPADEIPAPVDATQRIEPIQVAAAAGGPKEPSADVTTTKKKKRRWPWVLTVLVLLLGGGYVGAAYATQDSLPATLTVEGVDVSGLSVEEAAPELEAALGERAARDITVSVAEQDAVIVPAEAGYTFDVDATLEELTSLSFDPIQLWGRLFGEAHVDAVKTIDEDTSAETIAGLVEQLTYDPTEGSIVYEGDSLEYTAPIDGFTTDPERLTQLLAEEWLGEQTALDAPGTVEDPTVSDADWQAFIEATAKPLIAGPYQVTADQTSTELTAAQLGSAAEVRIEETVAATAETTSATSPDAETQDTGTQDTETQDDAETTDEATQSAVDRPVLHLDGEALTASLAENNADFRSTNQDATVRLAGAAGSGRPEVVPGVTGRGVQADQVVEEILADLAGDTTRAITVELHEVAPDISTEDAEAWDVNHIVAEYATPYPPHDGPRTANLKVGADRVNGTVVLPGEEFNLNSRLAPVTLANGYHSSGVVESGVATNAVGGGLSQIATMSYNAGFLGGMEIVEHKPHSRWFDRYPQGRESTYWEGQINVRWKNDTPAPVIVEMWLAGNQVHTRLWGADYYDVSTTTSEPYAFTPSPTIHNSDSQCTPERGGREGFTVDVYRSKTPPGGSAIEESWRWAYTGWPRVICD